MTLCEGHEDRVADMATEINLSVQALVDQMSPGAHPVELCCAVILALATKCSQAQMVAQDSFGVPAVLIKQLVMAGHQAALEAQGNVSAMARGAS